MRILVVEDEPDIADAVRRGLVDEGHAVDVVADGEEALAWAGTYPYQCIVLDVVLPGLDGLGVCARLRERGDATPVLMLTALDAVEDRVAGLDRGADDYLAKPFALSELRARVRALLRRQGDKRPVLRVGDLEVDPLRHEARRGGVAIRLTAREYALLEVLAREPGRIFSQDQLIDAVWDAAFDAGSNVVEVHVRSLRRKIDGGRRDGLIRTVRGAGYRLEAEPGSGS